MDADKASVRVKHEDNTKISDDENGDEESKDRNISARSRSNSKYSSEEARNQALRRELENVRNVNRVIEDATASLEKAKGNMEAISRTVTNASTLLNTWTRILSQTEHNQRLILNPSWQGANTDIAEAENELNARQQAAMRLEMEEQNRREAEAARKAEEEERRLEAAAIADSRGRRGGRTPTTRSSSWRSGYRRASTSGPGATHGSYSGRGSRVGSSTASYRAGTGAGRGTRTNSSSTGRSRGYG